MILTFLICFLLVNAMNIRPKPFFYIPPTKVDVLVCKSFNIWEATSILDIIIKHADSFKMRILFNQIYDLQESKNILLIFGKVKDQVGVSNKAYEILNFENIYIRNENEKLQVDPAFYNTESKLGYYFCMAIKSFSENKNVFLNRPSFKTEPFFKESAGLIASLKEKYLLDLDTEHAFLGPAFAQAYTKLNPLNYEFKDNNGDLLIITVFEEYVDPLSSRFCTLLIVRSIEEIYEHLLIDWREFLKSYGVLGRKLTFADKYLLQLDSVFKPQQFKIGILYAKSNQILDETLLNGKFYFIYKRPMTFLNLLFFLYLEN